MTGYELSRAYFDWAFENPELVSPNHAAIYFFAIEQCNKLGWKEKFGFPSQVAMDAIGIKKHDTYIKYLNELIEFGFIKLIQKSVNQHSANIISLQTAIPKNGKALGKATLTHEGKQTEPTGESNGESNWSIDKQQTINNKQQTNSLSQNKNFATTPKSIELLESRKEKFKNEVAEYLDKIDKSILNKFFLYWTEPNKSKSKMKFELEKTWDLKLRLNTWVNREK